VVEGDEEAVDRIELALGRGPIGARVESFVVEPLEPLRRATGFMIR
jgi:acylphosphatase